MLDIMAEINVNCNNDNSITATTRRCFNPVARRDVKQQRSTYEQIAATRDSKLQSSHGVVSGKVMGQQWQDGMAKSWPFVAVTKGTESFNLQAKERILI